MNLAQAVTALGLVIVASPCWSDQTGSRYNVKPLAGASIGWPLGLNGVLGVETGRVGARVSGAYWGRDLNGAELELSTPFLRTAHSQASVTTVIGTSRWDPWYGPEGSGALELRSYIGIGARLEWRGLFLAQGPCYRLNEEHAPKHIGRSSRFIWHLAAGYVLAFGG